MQYLLTVSQRYEHVLDVWLNHQSGTSIPRLLGKRKNNWTWEKIEFIHPSELS
jgi:hypothetical protein